MLSQAQAMAPEHPLVLNEAGVDKLHAGDASGARPFLERAIEKDGKNPTLWLNLATAFRKLNLPDDEMRALERVLAIEPRHLLALLQKGSLLELKGQPKAAASVFQNALLTIPRGTRLPEGLRPAIDRALNCGARESCGTGCVSRRPAARRSRPACERAAGAFRSLRRLHSSASAGFITPSPRSCSFRSCPRGSSISVKTFRGWMRSKRRARTSAPNSSVCSRRTPDGSSPISPIPKACQSISGPSSTIHAAGAFTTCGAMARAVDEHLARCPRTAELLSRAPLADVPGYAPTAFFSILDAKSHIPPHTGVTNTRLIVHLPLVIPGGCRFRVGSTDARMADGARVGLRRHDAARGVERQRRAARHPDLRYLESPDDAAECDLVRAAVRGVADYYAGEFPPASSG